MKQAPYIPFLIAVQIICIILHIHKHTLFIKESYIKQKNEKIKNELEHEHQQLTQQLCALRDYSSIEAFARTTLHMKPAHIHQIKKLPCA
ncbi:MAG: cell division protein FtsL [Candidatus Dependentiae bacterium]|nr:cell division protein FtsL [Candidatus Dependentiae bacterium]